MTVNEIEDAIDALPPPQQKRVYSHLTSRLFPQVERAGPDRDPVLELIDRLERETPECEVTDVASNYKEYLYGSGSDA